MKIRIKSTGEVVDAKQVGHGVYRDIFGATHLWTDIDMVEEPIYLCDHIDWEQRRYEIAKSMLSAVYKNDYVNDLDLSEDKIVHDSILYADELIKQLKGGDK